MQDVKLVRAPDQSGSHRLVLDVTEKLGPVENPHPDFIREWPLEYKEDPAKHRYRHVEIINGHQRFTIEVIDVLWDSRRSARSALMGVARSVFRR